MKLEYDSKEHSYRINSVIVPSVTQILKEVGLCDFSAVSSATLEKASFFGTATHKACELYDKGTLDINKLSAGIVPYLEAWKKFKADYKVEFTADNIEMKVGSEKWMYAGTLDRITKLENELTIIDIKTSTGINPSSALQLAGYMKAYLEMIDTALPVRRLVVQLKENSYNVIEYKKITDTVVFTSAIQLYKWKRGN